MRFLGDLGCESPCKDHNDIGGVPEEAERAAVVVGIVAAGIESAILDPNLNGRTF